MWSRIDRRRARARRLRTGVAVAVLLGTLSLLAATVVWRRSGGPAAAPPAPVAALALETSTGADRRSDGSVATGARWSLTTDAAELRVWRNGLQPVARCPGAPGCERAGAGWRLGLVLTEPGAYQALALERPVEGPRPDLAAVLAAARAAGIRTRSSDALVVY